MRPPFADADLSYFEASGKEGMRRQSPASIIGATVESLLDSVGTVLHPSIQLEMLDRIAADCLTLLKKEQPRAALPPPSVLSCDSHCLTPADQLGWNPTIIERKQNRMVVDIPVCPFETLATSYPVICALTSGIFGHLAVDAFPSAKLALKRGKGDVPRHCRITIYNAETPEAEGKKGKVYRREDKHHGPIWPSSMALKGPLTRLSSRQMEVLQKIGEGLTAKEIAADMHLSVRTVENHTARIRAKLGIQGHIRLARFAFRHQSSAEHDQAN